MARQPGSALTVGHTKNYFKYTKRTKRTHINKTKH